VSTAPDFSAKVAEALAKRAAQTCSNPACRRPTSAPHSEDSKATNLGEAAHIKGARPGSARFDPTMTDEERAAPSNGIWLCCVCAKRIDADPTQSTVELLVGWKKQHEAWVAAGQPSEGAATREVIVTGGGIGGVISNEGPGVAMEVTGSPGQVAERIHVDGRGIGEIVTNTGAGTAKVVRSSGATAASEVKVTVNQPVNVAAGLISGIAILVCDRCKTQFHASKVVQGFAGDREPRVQVKCPVCGWQTSV